MANYFRITAYHPEKNICAIFDSNGRFEKLWQFSAYLVQKGFKIVEVGADNSSTATFQRLLPAIYCLYGPAERADRKSMTAPSKFAADITR